MLRALKECLLRYIAYGWTGAMPGECRSTVVIVPINVARGFGAGLIFFKSDGGSRKYRVPCRPYHGGDFSRHLAAILPSRCQRRRSK
jgi:glycerophosphoryl diester phosphodiesterase